MTSKKMGSVNTTCMHACHVMPSQSHAGRASLDRTKYHVEGGLGVQKAEVAMRGPVRLRCASPRRRGERAQPPGTRAQGRARLPIPKGHGGRVRRYFAPCASVAPHATLRALGGRWPAGSMQKRSRTGGSAFTPGGFVRVDERCGSEGAPWACQGPDGALLAGKWKTGNGICPKACIQGYGCVLSPRGGFHGGSFSVHDTHTEQGPCPHYTPPGWLSFFCRSM